MEDGLPYCLVVAALKCAPRDKFIGWSDKKRIKRLKYIANNVRFLILPWVKVKNLALKDFVPELKEVK
jgi:hypothetical protein